MILLVRGIRAFNWTSF